MGFQTFLDANSVKNIDKTLVDVFDAVVGPALVISFGVPPTPPVPAGLVSLPATGTAAIIAKTGASSAAGATALFSLITADVSSLIIPLLLQGAIGLAAVPPIPAVGIPISPVALLNVPVPGDNAVKFAKAAIQWVVSLLPIGDPRTVPPITAP